MFFHLMASCNEVHKDAQEGRDDNEDSPDSLAQPDGTLLRKMSPKMMTSSNPTQREQRCDEMVNQATIAEQSQADHIANQVARSMLPSLKTPAPSTSPTRPSATSLNRTAYCTFRVGSCGPWHHQPTRKSV
jgi:hypothetical protein